MKNTNKLCLRKKQKTKMKTKMGTRLAGSLWPSTKKQRERRKTIKNGRSWLYRTRNIATQTLTIRPSTSKIVMPFRYLPHPYVLCILNNAHKNITHTKVPEPLSFFSCSCFVSYNSLCSLSQIPYIL
jgi:hypothetical protein